MTQRTDRIDELLRQEIGEIVRRQIDDPRIGFATITEVHTAPDLRHARVLVSVIGQAEERRATLAALGRAMPFVRHELGKLLHIKRIPELHLELDETFERGTRILHLLDELEAGRVPDRELPDGETLPTPRPLTPEEAELADGFGGAAAEEAARHARADARRRRDARTARPQGKSPGRRRR
jgi:ribosome-binding factor A